jgi:hypothetical protein
VSGFEGKKEPESENSRTRLDHLQFRSRDSPN